VAGSCSTSGLGTPDGALYCNDASAFDASTLTGELRDLADYLSSLAANGTVTATSWGDVKLTGTATTLNVFDLDLDDVASGFSTGVTTITGFTVTVPSGATAVVNVRGDSDVFMRNGAFTLVGTSAQKVLYNFGADTVITIESVGVKGSVLAPWADVAFDNAHIDGTLVGWTVTGTGQLHDYLFDGTLCLE
jgi:choice-of-anchor A domain-containing protein